MTRSQQQRRYDIDYVRQSARGQWIGILSHIGSISADLLDSRHHPCPKPECSAKTDGFRAFDDVAETGGVICNQCFNRDNNDGWKTLQWLTGKKFGELLPEVADHLGIRPESKTKNSKNDKNANPSEHLQFIEWNELLVSTWCLNKPPVTPRAVQTAGGKLARYRNQHTVIALPIWGERLSASPPVGWSLYNSSGGDVPSYYRNEKDDGWNVEYHKIHTTLGSSAGFIGPVDQISSARVIWKLEGPSDVLAFYSLPDVPGDVVAITNAFGAKEKPLQWMVDLVAGKVVYVLHDSDASGQDGAVGYTDGRGRHRPGWVTRFAEKASECRNVVLPFEIVKDKGKDLRDWIREIP